MRRVNHLPYILFEGGNHAPVPCQRVTFHAAGAATEADTARCFSGNRQHVVAIEHGWFRRMLHATIYLYEFGLAHFLLQDDIAGYYVSEHTEHPISVTAIDDLFGALAARDVEVRLLDTLWALGDSVQRSSLNWSLCRMGNAHPR